MDVQLFTEGGPDDVPVQFTVISPHYEVQRLGGCAAITAGVTRTARWRRTVGILLYSSIPKNANVFRTQDDCCLRHYFVYTMCMDGFTDEHSMQAISLFSGAGGMDVGFETAGWHVVSAIEKDTNACKTFRANHTGTDMLHGDINQHIGHWDTYVDIDLVFGGPPCQGFSVAGKMDMNDPRSQMVFRFCDVVDRVRPKAFVMENVKSLASLSKFAGIRSELESRWEKSGYIVQIHILNARDFGVPQSRERVFFIGFRRDVQRSDAVCISAYRKTSPTPRAVLTKLNQAGTVDNTRLCRAKVQPSKRPILRRSPYAGMLFNGQGRPINVDTWAGALPASMGGNRTPIIDEDYLRGKSEIPWFEWYHRHLTSGQPPVDGADVPTYVRRISIHEAALLQTFPADYQWCGSNSSAYSQIGNAVPCDLAYAVGSYVKDCLAYVAH